MEKIKEALAKARQQNFKKAPTASTRVTSKNTEVKSNASQINETDLDDISYINTSTIKLDQAHLEKHRIVANIKNDVNTGVFDSLRTQILQKMEENNWRTLAVVSPTPESGKTLVSINLAISISHKLNKTAILVDFDLRRPKVASYLGIHTEKSINDYLQNNAQVQEIMFNPGIPRFVVMPTMRPVPKSSETLASGKIATLVQELRERYETRIVIFDLPPVLNSDDALVFLPQVDCVLLVVANGASKVSEIEETLHHIPRDKLIGVVLNKAETEARDYYY